MGTFDSNTLAQNMTDSGFGQAFNGTFGNLGFQILPSRTGEVSDTFGTVPYLSLESIIQSQLATAQVSPTNIVSGQNSGQQNIQGSYTIQDANGLTRMVMGYQPGGF
jgi:hypothetical protein